VYGIDLNSIWWCCNGYCDYPVSVPPQLGWWGIGATTSREIIYSIDKSTTYYTLDLTNTTNAIAQIPSSTPNGFHTMTFSYFVSNEIVFSATTSIQILSDAECRSTGPDQFAPFCSLPCAGIATSTDALDLNNFLCGLRKFGCWVVMPDTGSISYLINQFNGLTSKFPLAPITELYNDLKLSASTTQEVTPGTISIPFYSTTSQQYIGQNFDIAPSSTIMGQGWSKFRRLEVIGMWCFTAGVIILILLRLIL
jgi:hypothetical protein